MQIIFELTRVSWSYNCFLDVQHTHNIRMCEIDLGNLKKQIGSGTKLLFTFLRLKVFWHEERERERERERETPSMLTTFTSSALNPTHARRPWRTKSSGLTQVWITTPSFGGRNSTPCFFSNPQNPQPTLSLHDVIHTPWSHFLLGFYFDICEWCILPARVNTCAQVCT